MPKMSLNQASTSCASSNAVVDCRYGLVKGKGKSWMSIWKKWTSWVHMIACVGFAYVSMYCVCMYIYIYLYTILYNIPIWCVIDTYAHVQLWIKYSPIPAQIGVLMKSVLKIHVVNSCTLKMGRAHGYATAFWNNFTFGTLNRGRLQGYNSTYLTTDPYLPDVAIPQYLNAPAIPMHAAEAETSQTITLKHRVYYSGAPIRSKCRQESEKTRRWITVPCTGWCWYISG